MQDLNVPIKQTDVLVMGSGGAGMRAAIAAAEKGARVIIAAKDLFGHSGCTPVAKGGYAGMQGPGDDWKLHFEDTVRGGGGINNQKLATIMAKDARSRLLELEEWGGAFDRAKDGSIFLRKFGGHSAPRSCISGDVTGREMIWALKRKCWENELIEIADETFITKLLVNDGKLSGAVGVNQQTGDITVYDCSVVILANGGSGRLWPVTFATKGKSGDGLRLAYEAGADLVDMEFFQIHPTGWKWPPAILGRVISEGVRADGGQLLNKNNERFMWKYDPELLELACRDYVSRCIYKEVQEGRGTEHGGVWLSVTHLTPEHIDRKLSAFKATGQVAGIDVRRQAVEIFPEHHYQNGGVRIDENARTTVRGLYAAGEAAGGVHGGNRLGTNSLADLLVFGKISGEDGAEYAKNVKREKINKSQVEDEIKAIRKPLENDSGVSVYSLSNKLHEVMFEEMHIERSGKGLNRCLEITAEVAKEFQNASIPGDSLRHNDAFVVSQEVRSRMVVGEIMTRASLYRTESRASLFRSDYPNVNRKEWDKNVIVSRQNGEVNLETVPVVETIWPTDKIDLPKFPVPGEEHEPGARVYCEIEDGDK